MSGYDAHRDEVELHGKAEATPLHPEVRAAESAANAALMAYAKAEGYESDLHRLWEPTLPAASAKEIEAARLCVAETEARFNELLRKHHPSR